MKTFFRNMLPGLWLIAAIPLSALIFKPLEDTRFIMGHNLREEISIIGFAIGHLVTGYLWSYTLMRLAGLPAKKLASLVVGIGFAVSVISIHGNLANFENLDVLLNPNREVRIQFWIIFVTWTGIVTGVTGFALGIGLMNWRLAFKMLLIGFITGAGVYFTVTFLMDLLGFRVGAPRADGIPSMPVVTPLGVWLSALVGSGVFGRVLEKHNPEKTLNQPVNDTSNYSDSNPLSTVEMNPIGE